GGAAPENSPAVTPEPAAPEDKNLEETRKNVQHLFPDDD
ncbi:plasmid stability family protein, partial [Salmonella enterica]|nr:plasmid stability family protein [Salmonella enterica]